MKIIIVGGGISGLSTYLHLRKHLPDPSSHSIKIYESHPPRSSDTLPLNSKLNLDTLSNSTALVGGGLGISPNGMRVLRDLNVDLHDAVAAQGFPAEKFVFKGANGWTLGVQRTGDGSVRTEGEPEEVCIASSRHGIWECLRKAVGEGVVVYRRVVGLERVENGGREEVGVRTKGLVDDSDGAGVEEVEEADLVIGADGVRSIVRTSLFGNEEKFKPTYTGLSGVGGFLTQSIPSSITKEKAMIFTFGRNGFFGYSSAAPVTTQSLMWWSTFETSSLPDTKNIDTATIKAELVKRHQHWRDPNVQEIVKNAQIQSIYPTWVLGELPHWGKEGIVLIGDAAHAMDPTTGQGASQGLEDSQTLALLLAETLKREHISQSQPERMKRAVDLANELFYEIRRPRVAEIVERGKMMSNRKANVGVVAEYFMYFFLWLLNKVPLIAKLILGDVNRKLYTWSAKNEIQKALEKRDRTSASSGNYAE
ncbi:hypothetical protein BDV96DRAFT_650653 [Lophiotrema nucula]|uniref:FAD-binding domain-containing protein n=1 Tax=Lophiotrema nucula TaxID=690887 RepID=A0A6A5YUT7_9PLEO|nr:hypothetical protein BDV96DRAFT_650653 [Lophiotrema nucula]